MSLFRWSSNIDINGGNFLDISGDFNIHTTQHAGMGQDSEPLAAPDSGWMQEPKRQLPRRERNGQHVESARMVPYVEDISRRPQLLGPTHDSPATDDQPRAISTSSTMSRSGLSRSELDLSSPLDAFNVPRSTWHPSTLHGLDYPNPGPHFSQTYAPSFLDGQVRSTPIASALLPPPQDAAFPPYLFSFPPEAAGFNPQSLLFPTTSNLSSSSHSPPGLAYSRAITYPSSSFDSEPRYGAHGPGQPHPAFPGDSVHGSVRQTGPERA
ncbi:hypothetical protein B0H13DRAFT_2331818 [Mycena leptocephala]|nr:hypothetical protein B0H13DRAFT_2331818 [Mycena leptocephala]